MLDQSVFTETIHEVAEIIRTSATPLTKEEILKHGFRVSADTT